MFYKTRRDDFEDVFIIQAIHIGVKECRINLGRYPTSSQIPFELLIKDLKKKKVNTIYATEDNRNYYGDAARASNIRYLYIINR